MTTDQQQSLTTETLDDAIARGDWPHAATVIEQLTGTQVVEALDRLPAAALATFLRAMGHERVAQLLARADPVEAARVLVRLSRPHAAHIIEKMHPDDAADVVAEVPSDEAEQILVAMAPAAAANVRDLLAYAPETAGGIMTPQFVSVYATATVQDALDLLRATAPDVETVFYVYVLDADDCLVAVLPFRDLVTASPATRVADIMKTEVEYVLATADQEDAAHQLLEADLLALPVVDERDHLLGVITIDDVADVLEEEATEDVALLGGATPLDYPYLRASVLRVAQARAPWLLVLFIAAFMTGMVLKHFDNLVSRVTMLVWFLPLVVGTGGNAGSQVATTIVRALAVGEVGWRDLFRVARKELLVGVVIAVMLGTVGVMWGWVLSGNFRMGLSVGLGQACVLVWATLVGAVLPLAVRRVGIDPALVSGPFMATAVDAVGLLVYFWIALWVLAP